jgi:Flp pilus assembly protein TadG
MLRRLRDREDGVVLILTVLLMIPLLLVIAIGLDLGQSLVVKRKLSTAVDAAALALGQLPTDITDEELDTRAKAYILAHYAPGDLGELTGYTVKREIFEDGRTQVDVTASASVPLALIKLGGIEKIDVAVSSQVIRQDKFLEVVMALDNSGSMRQGGKLAAMKAAAKAMTNILFAPVGAEGRVRVGLVPFTAAVNLGVDDQTTWLDRGNPAKLNKQYLDLEDQDGTLDVLDVMDGGADENWGGCVRSRADPYDTQDTPPDAGNEDTLFSAYFLPYKNPGKKPENKTKKKDYEKSKSSEQNTNCPDAKLQPLTGEKAVIDSAVDAMVADQNTNIAEGLAWAWRVISPDDPFTEGVAYSDQKTVKAIILLTDGQNLISGDNTFSSYGFGDAENPQLGANSNQKLNEKTLELCSNVKADKDGDVSDEDILLFTIAFNVSGPILELLSDCATTPGHFFESPTNGELQTTFANIASGLQELRIAK